LQGNLTDEVLTISLPLCNYHLLGDRSGYLLVDAGARGQYRMFAAALARQGIRPDQIKLIVVTHAHFDHVGNLHAIQSDCGCPVVAHVKEAEILREGKTVIPPGLDRVGKVLSPIGRRVPWLFGFKPVAGDHVSSDLSLPKEYGFAVTVVPTPGHTVGSVSVVQDTGTACVGDLMTSHWLVGRDLVCHFGDDEGTVYESWRALLRMDVHTFLPAHGNPISAVQIARRLAQRTVASGVPPFPGEGDTGLDGENRPVERGTRFQQTTR